MIRQHGFTIVTHVADGAVEDLTKLLDADGTRADEPAAIRFTALEKLHYASLAIFHDARGAPSLLFEGNVDGPRDAFLHDLVAASPAAVDAVYRHCVGYPAAGCADRTAVVRYLADHDLGAGTFYVAWPGRSVADVRREHELRDRLEAVLDGPLCESLRGERPSVVHHRVVEQVKGAPDLAWALARPAEPFLVRHGGKVVAAAGASAAAGVLALLGTALRPSAGRRGRRAAASVLLGLAGGAAGAAVELRTAERRDDRAEAARTEDWQTAYARWSENLTAVRRREDLEIQNHMLGVTPIKPGRFRLLALRAVLTAITLAARFRANRGSLGGISTIHFARWVVTPDRRQLLFLSNFDGSWERYLSDFIDLAASGLTAVWSNTTNEVGFPRTRWLIREGARDEARFKAFGRRSMVPTNVWYSAYPDVTVRNMTNDREIRLGLCAPLDDAKAAAWLRRL